MSTIQEILSTSKSFAKVIKFPLENNRVQTLLMKKILSNEEALSYFKETHPIVHKDVHDLIQRFLLLKREYGSSVEKSLYEELTLEDFVTRLFAKRAVSFVGPSDDYVLRNGLSGKGGFEKIGKEEEEPPLVLSDYLSYDEIKVSALLGLSSPTLFFNDGDRDNCGLVGESGSFENQGYIIGLVGARLEKPFVMEYCDMVVHQYQNVVSSGFGNVEQLDNSGATLHDIEINKLWANFYGIGKNLPLFESVIDMPDYVSVPGGVYFHRKAFMRRIELTAETLLLEANALAKKRHSLAYVYVVGFGLGVWALPGYKVEQKKHFLDAFANAVNRLNISFIDTVAFGWISGDLSIFRPKNKNLKVIFTKKPPQAKLSGYDSDKLLIVTYPWDGNSAPGNEYWYGSLNGSGDPAAASCSLIGEIQNAVINPFITGQNAVLLNPDTDDS